MESWFLADRENLAEYYGRRFRESALPDNRKVEQISKDLLQQKLKAATRDTQKREYHKTKHAQNFSV